VTAPPPLRLLGLLLVGLLLAGLLLGGSSPAAADPAETEGVATDGGVATAALCASENEELARARLDILAWIDARRRQAELPSVTPDAMLCRVAELRALQVAEAGEVDPSVATMGKVSRLLRAEGYQAHRWTERSMLGYRPPLGMVERWAIWEKDSFREVVLGEFEQVGVGVADAGEGTAVVLVLAVPRQSHLMQEVEGLRDLAEVRRLALERVNQARADHGLPPVVADPRLDEAAQAHADDMLERRYYGHVAPGGATARTWVRRSHYGAFTYLGENIAKGLFQPAEMVERWLASKEHRANILHEDAEQTGLGLAFGDTPDGFQVLWVQLFADPR